MTLIEKEERKTIKKKRKKKKKEKERIFERFVCVVLCCVLTFLRTFQEINFYFLFIFFFSFIFILQRKEKKLKLKEKKLKKKKMDLQTVCLICQMDKSSKPVALEPGCCGRWLHLDCLKLILMTGGNKCPSCSTSFPSSLLNIAQPPNPNPPLQPQPQAIPAIPVINPTIVANLVPQQQNQYPVIEAFALNQNINNNNNFPQFQPPQPQPQIQQRNYNNNRNNSGFGGRSSRSFDPQMLSKNPADPIEPWTPIIKQNSNLKQDQDLKESENESPISSRCIPEVPEICLDSVSNFHALVSFSSSNSSSSNVEMESRPPMDVVCVLDISGSMGSDNKLVNLKHAVNYIRSELQENDRLSVITFSTSSHLVHNLLRMNERNKVQTERSTNELHASGGTCILSGLQTAYHVLSNRQQANPITSVFLLTDGIDSSNMKEKQQTAQMIKEMGSSLFVFGFGSDHDSAHLQAIADAADGMFTFIERSDMVVDAFGGSLGAEQSIFATGIELHITSVNGSRIIQIESGMYANEISSDRSRAVVRYKNLMKGEERDVLVLMEVGEVGEEMNGQSQGLLRTCVRYLPLGRPESEGLLESIGGDCVVRRLRRENLTPNMTRNELVDVQVNRLCLTRATKQSIDCADSRNYKQARAILEEALRNMINSSSASNIRTQAFIQELQMALNDVSSETEFSQGGRSNMSEKAQNYSRQRMCYAKSASPAVYQNISSGSNQVRANKSKSGY